MILQANGKQKKAGVAILRQSRLQDLKKTMRDKEGHCIMIKGTFHQEDITLINIHLTQEN